MNQLHLFFELGLNHVLDINAYDHVLFFIVLVAVYSFKQWNKVLALVTLFTIGHTLSLVLSSFEIITVDSTIIEFLIPVTILLTAVYNLKIAEQNTAANRQYGQYIATLFFGLIHGFGFSTYFKMIATSDQKVLPLVGFAAGIEVSQILVVLAVLGISFICQSVLKVSRRDWIIVASSIVIGVVLPILFENWLW
jgi:hypothetical protein